MPSHIHQCPDSTKLSLSPTPGPTRPHHREDGKDLNENKRFQPYPRVPSPWKAQKGATVSTKIATAHEKGTAQSSKEGEALLNIGTRFHLDYPEIFQSPFLIPLHPFYPTLHIYNDSSDGRSYASSSSISESVSECTELRVPFVDFDRALLRSHGAEVNVDDIARQVVRMSDFQKIYANFLSSISNANDVECSPHKGPPSDAMLMGLINYSLLCAPKLGLSCKYVYDLTYRKVLDSESPYGHSDATRCVAFLKKPDEGTQFSWKSVAIAFHIDSKISHPEDGFPPVRSHKRRRDSDLGSRDGSPSRPSTHKRRRTTAQIEEQGPLESFPALEPQPEPRQDNNPHRATVPIDSPLGRNSPVAPTPPRKGSMMPVVDEMKPRHFTAQMMKALSNRRHSIGVLVTGLGLRFIYYDSAGSIFTTKLNLIKDIETIIAAFINLSFSSAATLGFEPNLFPSTPPPSALESLADCQLTINDQYFQVNHLLHADSQRFGRCSTILAVEPLARGTPREDAEEEALPQQLVMKLAWPRLDRSSEGDMYARAQRHGVPGVPKVYYSKSGGRLSDGLRGRMLPHSEEYVDRELSILCMGMYTPIFEVKHLWQFQTTFVSLLNAHHKLFKKAKILHRDIHPHNLMVDPDDISKGILLDLDLASVVKNPALGIEGRPCGALKYRSIDLVKHHRSIVKTYYRHDLESFLYSLVELLTLVRNGADPPSDIPLLSSWDEGTLSDMRQAKRRFIARPLYLPSCPWYVQLRESWVVPFARLFHNGYEARAEARRSCDTSFDDETLGGFVTYDTVMKALGL